MESANLSPHTAPRSGAYAGESWAPRARAGEDGSVVQDAPPQASPGPAGADAGIAAATPALRPEQRVEARARAACAEASVAAAIHARAAGKEVLWPLTVRAGDTLSSLAGRYARPDGRPRSWQELVAHNPQLADRPDLIHPGEVVRIPRSWALAASSDVRTAPGSRSSPPTGSQQAPDAGRVPTARPLVSMQPVSTTRPPDSEERTNAPSDGASAARATRTSAPVQRSAARTPAEDALYAEIVARGPAAANPGNVYEQAIVANDTAEGLQRFVDGALKTLARRSDDMQARVTWTRNIRVALGRAMELGITLR